ncbi:helix-turn-helix transcriptional regulator [Lysinibacillus sp. NPDC094403]|uniref:helix-turn-helix transcriptional regulator n=1 Tax=Lysinibacillus sp. NPDC094403 TaxID=3390581 RepID=UPI003CFFB947
MKKDFGDSIANNVYEYHVLARMSQQELAEKDGVSKQTIFVMEKGNFVPTLLLAFRIAEFFSVDVKDIFTYEKGNDQNYNLVYVRYP